MKNDRTLIQSDGRKLRHAPGFPPALAAFFLIGISQSSTGPLLPLFEERFGAGAGGASLLITSYFVGALAAMTATSASRMPESRIIPPAAVVYSLGCGGVFFSGDLWLTASSCLFAGFGSGVLILAVNSIFARQHEGVSLVNLVNGMFAAGTIAGPLIASVSISSGRPYGFLVAAVGALLCVRVRRVAEFRTNPTHTGTAEESRPGTARNASFVGFFLLYALYGGIETGIGSWAAKHIVHEGFTDSSSARVLAVFWAGTALSKFLMFPLASRVAAPRVVTVGLLGTAGGLLLATAPGMTLAGYSLAGLFLGPVFPTGLAWIAKAGGDRRTTGLAASSSMVGSIVFPAATGWLVAVQGPGPVPVAIAGIAVCAAIAAHWTAVVRA
ncbi:MFS transporter [Streptomyces sp. NPDC057686]|uniref:MFS transporter n=1 Tax=Streptomyces sp. NPDC057686 TaxID=3346212 RepID=UPI00368B6954